MPAKTRSSKKFPIPPYPGTRDKGKESLVKVAAIQFEPHIGNKDYSVREGLKMIAKAGKMGAKLMVLPELCNTGYIYNSREEAFAMAELPLEELPLAAEDRERETGTATLFMLRQGAVTGVKPLVLHVHGRSGGLKINGRISGLPKGVSGSDLVCLLDVGKEETSEIKSALPVRSSL